MSKQQILIADLIIMFMMLYGFDLLAIAKYHTELQSSRLFNPYQITQFIYGWGTLITTRWLLKKTIPQKRYAMLVLGLLGIFIGFALARYILEELILFQILGKHNYPVTVTPLFYFLDNLYYVIIYCSLGATIFFVDAYLRSHKNQLELIKKNKEAELGFLRSQMNPHFLFNSLNNIYALSYKKSEKAPEAILKLSELTRYMLYEKKEFTPLSTEWSYVQHFIALQKMRYDRDINLTVNSSGNPDEWMIPPYLLIGAVENVFKHADFSRDQAARIELVAGTDNLSFRTENRIGQHQKDQTGGIGLENMKKRLELLYPGRHKLEVSVTDQCYILQLLISR